LYKGQRFQLIILTCKRLNNLQLYREGNWSNVHVIIHAYRWHRSASVRGEYMEVR